MALGPEALRLAIEPLLELEGAVLEFQEWLDSQTESLRSKGHRDYLLRQKMQVIQNELEEKNPELDPLRRKLAEDALPANVREAVNRELGRLERAVPGISDFEPARSWLELVAELPWSESPPGLLDLGRARQSLEEDHHGLKEVKERVLEHLAVMKLNPKAQ